MIGVVGEMVYRVVLFDDKNSAMQCEVQFNEDEIRGRGVEDRGEERSSFSRLASS